MLHDQTISSKLLYNGSRTIAPEENSFQTPKLTLSQTLTLTGGQLSSGAIVWFLHNPKTNPQLDPNPNPNQGAISSGGGGIFWIFPIPSFRKHLGY